MNRMLMADKFCRRMGRNSRCQCCPQRPILQVQVTAFGVGDHVLGLCASEGLRRQHPDHDVVYCAKNHGLGEWVRLFGGYDHLVSRPLTGVTTYQPHETYPLQTVHQTQPNRWTWYSTVTGAPCVLPDEVALPAEAVRWAKKYAGAVVLAPWSHWRDRCWPLGCWEPLEWMLMKRGCRVVILDVERDRNATLKSELVIGESPARVAALIRAASCVVGNDSGMVHVAGMVRTPAVALCSAIAGEKVFGLYPPVTVLNSPLSCADHHWDDRVHPRPDCSGRPCIGLQSITPERVLQAVEHATCRRAWDHTLLTPAKLAALRRAARETAHLEGDMAEVGVFKGGSALAMASACPDKTIHLFDTFSGLPHDDTDGPHRKGEFAGSQLEVGRLLADYKADIHVGMFPETARGLEDKRFSIVHLDADLYQTTRDALAWFWPRMMENGVIVLDDAFGWTNTPGVDRAIAESGLPVEQAAQHQAWIRKRAEAPPAVTNRPVRHAAPKRVRRPVKRCCGK
jgi:O-methyltransferase